MYDVIVIGAGVTGCGIARELSRYNWKAAVLEKASDFQLPTIYGKGVLVTPTVHGNLLAGPTAVDIEDHEAVNQ